MTEEKHKLTLDQPVTYQIKVPGQLDERWSEWVEGITITVESERDDSPITVLTGTIDQAALQGLLRRLYSLGLPLISVHCLHNCDDTIDKQSTYEERCNDDSGF